jgi:NADH-quinone oxidoreductase subunit N
MCSLLPAPRHALAEAGSNISSWARSPPGILLYGISLLYGFTGSTLFGDIYRALARRRLDRRAVRASSSSWPGIAFKVGRAVPHVDSGRLRRRPTPVTAFFASAPKVAAMCLMVRVAIEAMGPATFEWRQIVIFSALASTIWAASLRSGSRISSGCSLTARSTMSASR